MKIFIYYRNNQEGSEPDVAAVKAKSINEAVELLSKYYSSINKKEDIYELDFEKGEGKDVIIISDY